MKGLLLLRQCINAEVRYRSLVNEYVLEREVLFAGHYPGYETKYGMLQQETISTENTALYLMEAEERFEEQVYPLRGKREKLQKALRRLNDKELEVFNHLVWGEQTNISPTEIKQLEQPIMHILCSYLDGKSLEVVC